MSKKHLKKKTKQRMDISKGKRFSDETKQSENRRMENGGISAYMIRLKRTGNDNQSAMNGYYRMISRQRNRNDG